MTDKEEKIKEEQKFLLKLYGLHPLKKHDGDITSALLRRTIGDLAFQRIEMDELMAIIASEGWQEEYQHGEKQSGMKQTSAAKSYFELQKLYNATIRRLKQITDGTDMEAATDELLDFLKG